MFIWFSLGSYWESWTFRFKIGVLNTVNVIWEDREDTIFMQWPRAGVFLRGEAGINPSEACSCIQSPAGLQFRGCAQKPNDGKYLQPVYGNWSAPQGEEMMTELLFFPPNIYRIRCTVPSLKGNEIQHSDRLEIGQHNPIPAYNSPPSCEQNYMLRNRLEINLLDRLLFYSSDQGVRLESCHEDQI